MLNNPNLSNYGDVSTILNLDSLKNIQKIIKLND